MPSKKQQLALTKIIEGLCKEMTYQTTVMINLSNHQLHQLSTKQFTLLMQHIRKSNLQTIYLARNQLFSLPLPQWKLLCDSLCEAPQLKQIDLRYNYSSDSEEHSELHAQQWAYLCNTLAQAKWETLNLSYNALLQSNSIDPTKQFANALASTKIKTLIINEPSNPLFSQYSPLSSIVLNAIKDKHEIIVDCIPPDCGNKKFNELCTLIIERKTYRNLINTINNAKNSLKTEKSNQLPLLADQIAKAYQDLVQINFSLLGLTENYITHLYAELWLTAKCLLAISPASFTTLCLLIPETSPEYPEMQRFIFEIHLMETRNQNLKEPFSTAFYKTIKTDFSTTHSLHFFKQHHDTVLDKLLLSTLEKSTCFDTDELNDETRFCLLQYLFLTESLSLHIKLTLPITMETITTIKLLCENKVNSNEIISTEEIQLAKALL